VRGLTAGVVRTLVVLRGGMPPTSLLGPLGDRRGVGFTSVELAAVRSTARAAGATVNDVLLEAVAEAGAALLRSRGEAFPEVLPVSVPVSLRDSAAGTPGNRVGIMRVLLPLDVPDPVERLRRIASVTRGAKVEARRAGTMELTRSRLGARLFDVFSRHQRTIGLFVTDVPGPVERPTLGGATLLRAWPLTPNAGNVRVAVAALSLAGALHVTTTFDVRSCPDAEVFTNALAAALQRGGDVSPAPAHGPDEIGRLTGAS
jgi:hypothetical protein